MFGWTSVDRYCKSPRLWAPPQISCKKLVAKARPLTGTHLRLHLSPAFSTHDHGTQLHHIYRLSLNYELAKVVLISCICHFQFVLYITHRPLKASDNFLGCFWSMSLHPSIAVRKISFVDLIYCYCYGTFESCDRLGLHMTEGRLFLEPRSLERWCLVSPSPIWL